MKKKTKKNITTFEEHLEKRYGKIGTPKRDKFEEKAQYFVISEMLKEARQVPEFKSNEKEKEFWKNIDLTEYYSKGDFKGVSFPDLKPTSRSISIRLPEFLLTRLKEKANELNIPYQSLIKQYLSLGLVK